MGKRIDNLDYSKLYCLLLLWWFRSRRIDDKNRIVYWIVNNIIQIIQCGSHYREKSIPKPPTVMQPEVSFWGLKPHLFIRLQRWRDNRSRFLRLNFNFFFCRFSIRLDLRSCVFFSLLITTIDDLIYSSYGTREKAAYQQVQHLLIRAFLWITYSMILLFGEMGSNPILSATLRGFAECGNNSTAKFSFLWHLEDYPSGEGAPLLRE